MKLCRIGLLISVVLVGGVAVSACGGDDEEKDGAATPAGSPSANETTIEVTAKEFSFSPADLDVIKGEPVTFEVSNKGAVSHTFTVYTDDKFTDPVEGADTGTISSGDNGEFTVTFHKAADFYFRCDIHPTQMQGEISVK